MRNAAEGGVGSNGAANATRAVGALRVSVARLARCVLDLCNEAPSTTPPENRLPRTAAGTRDDVTSGDVDVDRVTDAPERAS